MVQDIGFVGARTTMGNLVSKPLDPYLSRSHHPSLLPLPSGSVSSCSAREQLAWYLELWRVIFRLETEWNLRIILSSVSAT